MTQIPRDLQLSSYDYALRPELIADRPSQQRHNSKLLVYRMRQKTITHDYFYNLPSYLKSSDTIVLNQSGVFPCRLLGKKASGGKAEVFILKMNKGSPSPCLIKTSGKKNRGDEFFIGEFKAVITGVEKDHFFIDFPGADVEKIIDENGKIPIPPYIRGGQSDDQDLSDYQTVFAKVMGSVAAPTAGLHFTAQVLDDLKNKGIKKALLTLHVGPGTFAPVKTQEILSHQMHREDYHIEAAELKKLNDGLGGLIAVGTTSLRTLESAFDGKSFCHDPHQWGSTDIFLHPGKEIKTIRGLLTNFHLPRSTLLMLVSSFIGREQTMALYECAIKHQYRFYSYGDAMLLLDE